MSRQTLYTAMGIALSFVIAVGGWLLTSVLIDKKSDALFSATGITHVDVPLPISASPVNPGDTDSVGVTQKITEAEIADIMMNWENQSFEKKPHEPTSGQITMEQAIEAGKAGLLLFSDHSIIPADLFEWDTLRANAYLCQNLPRGQNEQFLDPIYSYWTVTCSNGSIKATLIVNAVTGQIWKAEISFSPAIAVSSGVNAAQALDTFISYLGMHSDERVYVKYDEKQSISASQNIADGLLYADASIDIRKNSVETFDNTTVSEVFLLSIYMSLSTTSNIVEYDIDPG